MVEKITIDNIIPKKKIVTRPKTKHYKKTKPIPKDSFEKTNLKARLESEIHDLQFERIEIEFYPEDIEKMKNMTLEEENDYVAMLKKIGKYIIKGKKNQ